MRREPTGQRRYLDAEWLCADGRVVAIEVDGAVHLEVAQWSADQLRQNEITIAGSAVLRFPSVVVRHEPELVVSQLRRALRVPDQSARPGPRCWVAIVSPFGRPGF